jgi:hypothetical protein
MIVLTRKFVQAAEVWFDEPVGSAAADLIVYYHWSAPVGARTQDFHSVEVDLSSPEQALLGDMTDTNRYEINRAGSRDGVVFTAHDHVTSGTLRAFCDFFDGFADERGIARAARSWLELYAQAGQLMLSTVSAATGETLAWHSYYRGPRVARQMQSASYFRKHEDPGFRNLMSRASRLHYWKDMVHFKSAGLSVFDFGGWYAGTEDEQKLRINKFKESFGGKISKRFYGVSPVTLKGRVYMAAVERLRKEPFFPHMV